MYSENVEDVAATLQFLAQYEIDGSFIISQAMASISNTNINEHLAEIREECERNIEKLADLICEYGREAPDHTRDFKGFFMQGYTGMRGLLSDKGAMRALQTNLGFVAKAYEKVLESDGLPSEIKGKLQALYNVVKDHLEYVASQA